jgi:hypothetical protein
MVNRSFADMRRTPVRPAPCRAFFCADLRASHRGKCDESRLLLAANHHRTILHIRAKNPADRAARSRAVVDIFRNDVIAIVAADFTRALVTLGPTRARVAAAAVDGKAGVAARQVGHRGGAGATAEAAECQQADTDRRGRRDGRQCAFHTNSLQITEKRRDAKARRVLIERFIARWVPETAAAVRVTADAGDAQRRHGAAYSAAADPLARWLAAAH